MDAICAERTEQLEAMLNCRSMAYGFMLVDFGFPF
jgi:hypothetical protein